MLAKGINATAQDASTAPYRGGPADGFSQQTATAFIAQNSITAFAPFKGGMGSGFSSDSLVRFNPNGSALLYSPYAGGIGQGYAADSLISFAQGYIVPFTPYAGGTADGYATDSLIAFNPRAYIAMYTPYAGGLSDGHTEGTLCKFPNIEGDTTLFLKCLNDTVNLNQLVGNFNFAGRWNTANPTSVGPGNYELRINNAGKCLDTATVIVQLEVATWLGTQSSNWHQASNWSTGKVPTAITHVIVPNGTPFACIISEQDATCASVQARTGGALQALPGRNLFIQGLCAALPL